MVTDLSCAQFALGRGGASSRVSSPTISTDTRPWSLRDPNVADDGMSELDSLHARMFARSKPGGIAGPPLVEAVEKGDTAAGAGTGVSRISIGSSIGGTGGILGGSGKGGGVSNRAIGLPGAVAGSKYNKAG